jgi:hypothetical protein
MTNFHASINELNPKSAYNSGKCPFLSESGKTNIIQKIIKKENP